MERHDLVSLAMLCTFGCGGAVVPSADASADSMTVEDAPLELADAVLTTPDAQRPPHDGAVCLARPAATPCTSCGVQPCGLLRDLTSACFTQDDNWCGGWTIAFDEDGCATRVTSPASAFSACVTKALATTRWPCEADQTSTFFISCGPN
jgi:hypothetical protein